MTDNSSNRPLYELAASRTVIMGIVNVTPDSFFDGGSYLAPDAAIAQAKALAEHGAHIVDIGGESSRPGANPVSQEEELARILPVLDQINTLDIPVSVDTYRAETAKKAIEMGAAMINDITALRKDGAMAGVIAQTGVECVLMHMQGDPETMQRDPQYTDVIDDISAFFEERLEYSIQKGISEKQIWLDPGFGFGKTIAHNLELLRRLSEFKRFGRPILIGTSNKSTIGAALNAGPAERDAGTAATTAVAIANGADAIRAHNVKMMAQVARMTDAIYGKSGGKTLDGCADA